MVAWASAAVCAASSAAASTQRLAVSAQTEAEGTVRMQVRAPGTAEPELAWSGTGSARPYRLSLTWRGTSLAPEQLPSTQGLGPVESVTVSDQDGDTRLEVQLRHSVMPSLRRSGDGWTLRLLPDLQEPAPHAAAPQALAAPARTPTAATATATATAAQAPASPPLAAQAPPTQAPPPRPSAPQSSLLSSDSPRPAPQRAPEPALARPMPPAGEPPVQVALALPSSPQPRAPRRPPAVDLLLVDLTINGQRRPNPAQAEQRPDGSLLLAANAWTDARLVPAGQEQRLSDGTPAYVLQAVQGLRYQMNRSALSLEIDAPATAFVGSRFEPAGAAAPAPATAAPAVLLNYDVSVAGGTQGTASTSGATVEGVASGNFGSVVASALVADRDGERKVSRLDTYWRMDLPERMETVVVGDTVGVGGGWSRPARYGGVRWGREFGLRPGYVTMPQITLSSEAALPSTVDVLVNNARRLSQPVAPGPFDLSNVPVVTGAGEVNLVVRDLLGRETVIQQSYYASPRLLAPGLNDYSLEAGWLRSGYGESSRYGDAFAAGTWRSGISDALTAEGRVELQADRRAAGAELAGLLGTWAVARGAVAHADSDRSSGQLLQLGLERSTPHGGLTLQYEHATLGFVPFAESSGMLAARRVRERWLLAGGGRLWGGFSGGANLVRQTRWDGDQLTALGLSVGAPVGGGASVNLNLNKRLDGDGAWSAAVTLNVPLDDGVSTGARVQRTGDSGNVATVSATRNPPAGPGLGWRVEASTERSQRARGGLLYNAEHAELAADVAASQGRTAVRAGARGTLGVVGGVPFAARPVGEGGFALVEVEGMEGVPIKRSNQVVAHTDASGRALVTGLLPWQANQIDVDAEDLPLDAELSELSHSVTPRARAGATVKIPVRRSRQALVVLQQASGEPVPVGTRVRLGADGAEFTAGRRGEVWLTGLAAQQQSLQVQWPGGACRLQMDVPPEHDGMPTRIGPLVCAGARP